MLKEKHKQLYMDIAKSCAKMSYAKRLQVGVVIVKDDNIISHSWNGTPPGFDNNCETFNIETQTLITKPEVLHAEENALCKLAATTFSAKDAELFCTHSPCYNCSKMIFRAGIKKVYYIHEYRDTSSLDFLRKAGVEVEKMHG